MKPCSAVAVAAFALLAATPVVSSASAFSINFDAPFAYAEEIGGYYSGGTALGGSTGPNQGVSFVNFFALANDPSFTYYSGAPSPAGTAYPFTSTSTPSAFLNVAAGVSNALSLFYSSPAAVTGAVKAYSGLNGTGVLLGSVNFLSNVATVDGAAVYNAFSLATLAFAGVARSFDFTAIATSVGADGSVVNGALLDNIATVPEPATILMVMAGGTALAGLRIRRRRA